MNIDHQPYRAGLSGEDLVSELKTLLAIEQRAIRLTCRYLADLADCIEARTCWALGVYRDVYHAAQSLLGIGVHSTRERVRVGRAVRRLPRIDQALVNGELSYSRAREVTRVAQPEDEGQWLELARALPMRQLEMQLGMYAAEEIARLLTPLAGIGGDDAIALILEKAEDAHEPAELRKAAIAALTAHPPKDEPSQERLRLASGKVQSSTRETKFQVSKNLAGCVSARAEAATFARPKKLPTSVVFPVSFIRQE